MCECTVMYEELSAKHLVHRKKYACKIIFRHHSTPETMAILELLQSSLHL